jgi:hypothetical protein
VEIRGPDYATPIYPQNLALTLVGIVRTWTQATGFVFVIFGSGRFVYVHVCADPPPPRRHCKLDPTEV